MKKRKEDIIQLVKDALLNNKIAQYDLYTIIYKHYRAQKISEDVINEMYFKFLKNAKIEEIFNENKLWGYLNYIKKSCLVDMYRQNKYELNIEEIGDVENEKIYVDAIEEKTALDIMISNEQSNTLYYALEQFREANKMLYDVIYSFYFEDLKMAEIASKYNIKYITVKHRLHRAKIELQKYFQKKQK
jgi:RNA polymerase sigma factor (sigma-70 family)